MKYRSLGMQTTTIPVRTFDHTDSSRSNWLLGVLSGIIEAFDVIQSSGSTTGPKLRRAISKHGRTSVSDVDGGQLRHSAEAERAHAVPRRAHARALVPLQPGVCWLRQDPVSRPCPEDGP